MTFNTHPEFGLFWRLTIEQRNRRTLPSCDTVQTGIFESVVLFARLRVERS